MSAKHVCPFKPRHCQEYVQNLSSIEKCLSLKVTLNNTCVLTCFVLLHHQDIYFNFGIVYVKVTYKQKYEIICSQFRSSYN